VLNGTSSLTLTWELGKGICSLLDYTCLLVQSWSTPGQGFSGIFALKCCEVFFLARKTVI
jgi:hypothetical protein